MKDVNKSRRKLIAGSGAVAVGSVLTGGIFPKSVLAQSLDNGLSHEELNIPGVKSTAPFIYLPTNAKLILRQQITDILKFRLEKSLSPVLGKVLGKAALGAIAPIVMIIFDIIFPSGLTMEGIKEEIDKRISAALDEYEFTQVQKKFIALFDAYSIRMESVKAQNSGITDQSQWSLGTPAEWEALIFCCLELKNYFYNNDQFSRTYEAASLVHDFNAIYYLALNSRLQCFKDGDDVGKTAELIEELLMGQYRYIEKLMNIGYFDVHSPKHIELTDWGTPAFQWRTANVYPNDYANSSTPSLSGYDKYDNIRWTHDIIRERTRLYHLLNTEAFSMCEAHSIAVKGYNSMFNKNLPDAKEMITSFITDNYVKPSNDAFSKSPYTDGGGYEGLTLPAFTNNVDSSNPPFTINDPYVLIQAKSAVLAMLYTPGDYPNILNPANQLEIGIDLITAKIPRGMRIIFYSEPNFGEENDYVNDNITYKGRTYLKPLEGVVDFSDLNNLPDFKVKSMKIRVDPAHWFRGITQKTIGSVPLVEYENKGGGIWTTGPIKMAAVTNTSRVRSRSRKG